MTTNALIERLAMLACGAEPYSYGFGIAYDIHHRVSPDAAQILFAEWRKRGADPWIDRSWTGTPGRRRRALCRRTVYWLVSKYGYSGEWCK